MSRSSGLAQLSPHRNNLFIIFPMNPRDRPSPSCRQKCQPRSAPMEEARLAPFSHGPAIQRLLCSRSRLSSQPRACEALRVTQVTRHHCANPPGAGAAPHTPSHRQPPPLEPPQRLNRPRLPPQRLCRARPMIGRAAQSQPRSLLFPLARSPARLKGRSHLLL